MYVPDSLTTPAPMVMALHGCKQTNNDVLNDWGLTAAADEYGFILVAPFITSYDGLRNENCWVGGENGNNGKWSIKVGPSYPDIIWDFFQPQQP